MSKGESRGRDMALSFMPERYLVSRRNVWALKHKYESRLRLESRESNRLFALLEPGIWEPSVAESPLTYSKEKYLGGLMITGRMQSFFAAYDPERPDNRIRMNKKDATIMDLLVLKGVQHLREQLEIAAFYVNHHEPLRRTKYVAGVTYPAMGRLATALGFRQMELETVTRETLHEAYAVHVAYSAVNGRDPGELEDFWPVATYLPTEEFVQRFGVSSDMAIAKS